MNSCKRHIGRTNHLAEQQRRFARDSLPRGHATSRQIDGSLMHRPCFAHHGDGATRQTRARPPRRDHGLVGLVKIDVVKACLRSKLAFCLENGLNLMEFSAGQRVEGMRGLRLLCRGREW